MGNPSWDLFLVGFVVGALLWFIPGKDRIIHMVSIYMALAVVTLPEFVLNIKVNIATRRNYAFLSVFIVLFFLLYVKRCSMLGSGGEAKWWQTLVFSVLHIGSTGFGDVILHACEHSRKIFNVV